MSHLRQLASKITESGLPLPAPIASFIDGRPRPLAYSVRDNLPGWCAANGYSEDQQESLANIVRIIVRHDRYLKVVAAESTERVDLDGQVEAPVSDEDRDNAAKVLSARKRRHKRGKAVVKMKPPETDAPLPAPVTTSPTPPPARSSASFAISIRPRFAGSPVPKRQTTTTARPSSAPKVSAAPPPRPVLPTAIIREVVERVDNRRGSTRLIRAYLKSGNHSAIAAERTAWINDAAKLLVVDGHDRAAASHQVNEMVDFMLIGIVPKGAWT